MEWNRSKFAASHLLVERDTQVCSRRHGVSWDSFQRKELVHFVEDRNNVNAKYYINIYWKIISLQNNFVFQRNHARRHIKPK